MPRLLPRALVTGAVASLTSSVALAAAARLEGLEPARPINATSHWLHGDRAAASARRVDWRHTGVGYATHLAATVFWAAFFEAWRGTRPRRSAAGSAAGALAVSALAAAVDYGATPKRFTPGWELVLSKRAMAAAYLAMALGMVAAAPLAGAPGPRQAAGGRRNTLTGQA